MTDTADTMPYVDTHAITIDAPVAAVWDALVDHVDRSLLRPRPRLAGLLGTQPPAGFEVIESEPQERLVLAGRHRFARYRLTFTLDAARLVTLAAVTQATFPGLPGQIYRTLVIRSRLHVVATRRILAAVRRATVA